MKVLWIVNTPIGALGEYLYHQRTNGLWMDALLSSFYCCHNYQLHVVTTAAISKHVQLIENGIFYHALPNQVPILYNENDPDNIAAWKELFADIQPDLIQIWGTEFSHGLCALRVAKHIPSVIYMQGYLGSIARYYLAGITLRELHQSVTLRDIIKHDSILQQQKKYFKSALKENEMIQISGNVISENEWCNMSITAINPAVKLYNCPLSINTAFAQYSWSIHNARPYSIICTASGYPLKGLHMVLRAVAMIKKTYPDVKLYVPGPKMVSDNTLQWQLRKRGYTKYIESLIRKLDLVEQVVWLGVLSQSELAKQYAQSRVFVLSSSIENHSSSLKEAMMVGTPSVAASVGGIPEYLKNGENGFLYRFEEYEIMAEYIKKLFEDDELSLKFSVNSRNDMRRLHGNEKIFQRITSIYTDITGEN